MDCVLKVYNFSPLDIELSRGAHNDTDPNPTLWPLQALFSSLTSSQILSRGAHIDDVDGLTGMTLLHFACKSASEGVGDVEKAVSLVEYLIKEVSYHQSHTQSHTKSHTQSHTQAHPQSHTQAHPNCGLVLTPIVTYHNLNKVWWPIIH